MAAIDYSQPLATVLKESTKQVHETLEHSQTAVRITRGELELDDYVRFLMMLYNIYSTLEDALERHSAHPTLEPTYNPPLLARAPALSADIAFYLEVSESEWKSHALYKAFLASPPQAMQEYVSRIQELSDSSDPSGLLGHSYVRYLGDLSGGQTIRHTLAKAYGLEESTGEGLKFYAFKQLDSAAPATQGDMKRIKEWFREGMNKAGEQGEDVKVTVSREAMKVFLLNKELFDAIVSEESEMVMVPAVVKKPGQQEGSGYSTVGVMTFILAVGLAHFLLVVFGFTGSRGYSKLVSVENWLSSLFPAMMESAE